MSQDEKIVLIVATGRSGSTTLQRIINTIPNSNICGENYGAILALLQFYRNIKVSTCKYIPGGKTPLSYNDILRNGIKPSWYNSYNIDDIVQQIRQMIRKLFQGTNASTIWGFKEIRFDNNQVTLLNEFVELFPHTKIIIHIRENITQQSKSSWYRHNPNESVKYLQEYNKQLISYYQQHTSYCYLSTFERMFEIDHVRNIFTYIGCDNHFNEKSIRDILQNNIKD